MLHSGDQAPSFTLSDANEQPVSLADYRGRKVVVYFYPQDDTPGCTLQAQKFTEAKTDFDRQNVVILGISQDSTQSHADFAAKYALDVVLLSDPDHAVQEAYGVWQQKEKEGEKYMGTVRTTFLIDEAGKIVRIWPNVDVESHIEEVLAAVR